VGNHGARFAFRRVAQCARALALRLAVLKDIVPTFERARAHVRGHVRARARARVRARGLPVLRLATWRIDQGRNVVGSGWKR